MLWSKQRDRRSPRPDNPPSPTSQKSNSSGSTIRRQSNSNTSSTSSLSHSSNSPRYPLAQLDPQSTQSALPPSSFSQPADQMPTPITSDYGEMAKYTIARPIVTNRVANNEEDMALSSSKRKGTQSSMQPGALNKSTSRRAGEKNVGSQSGGIPSSRRTSLPAIHFRHPSLTPPAATGSSNSLSPNMAAPSSTSSLSQNQYQNPACITNDDLYKGLSTFTFGEPSRSTAPSPSPSYDADAEPDEFISPLTPVHRHPSADRTPRPSVSITHGRDRKSVV